MDPDTPGFSCTSVQQFAGYNEASSGKEILGHFQEEMLSSGESHLITVTRGQEFFHGQRLLKLLDRDPNMFTKKLCIAYVSAPRQELGVDMGAIAKEVLGKLLSHYFPSFDQVLTGFVPSRKASDETLQQMGKLVGKAYKIS